MTPTARQTMESDGYCDYCGERNQGSDLTMLSNHSIICSSCKLDLYGKEDDAEAGDTVDLNVGCAICGADTEGRKFHDTPLCLTHHDAALHNMATWFRAQTNPILDLATRHYEGEAAEWKSLLDAMIAKSNEVQR